MKYLFLFLQSHRIFVVLAIVVCIFLLAYILYRILKNPFSYPYFIYEFDVSGKRNVQVEDYIDRFLCDGRNWLDLMAHEQVIQQWKIDTEKHIQSCVLKKYRARQYHKILDDKKAYRFLTTRNQTRYRQQNYVKTAYTVPAFDSGLLVNWEWLEERYNKLSAIRFEATLSEYESKNQRKLMTRQLRVQIMERDCFTCQICGKYMPDEVGLHIDHIVPVVRGGKSVPSNLRVLCSKCNGRKGAK